MVGVVTQWPPERVAVLAGLLEQGLSYTQAAERMGTKPHAARGAAQRHGLMRPERRAPGQEWTREDFDTLERYLDQNLKFAEIGRRMGRTYNGIRCAVDRLGLTDRERSRYRRRPDWHILEPIIIDCIESELMSGPQIIKRLASMGVTLTNAGLHNHLQEMHPSLRNRIRRNAQRNRNAWIAIHAKRRAAIRRHQERGAA